MRALEILSANLRWLGRQPGHPSSGPGVERAAKALGLNIGRSTVGRCLIAQGNPSLDNIETLAKVFGVRAWQLLHPTLGAVTTGAHPRPDPLRPTDDPEGLLALSESAE